MFLIDTHCHLDAPEFDADRSCVVERAAAHGVSMLVLPAVCPARFAQVRVLAHTHHLVYALGIHPGWVDAASEGDLEILKTELQVHQHDPRLVAVGEIGLDHALIDANQDKAQYFLTQQLALAEQFELPVIMHSRRSHDCLSKHLRRVTTRGIVHAFNGSMQQAQTLVGLGYKLGFGGVMTFERAAQVRRLAQSLPQQALVLETDAPDLPAQWLAPGARHEPMHLSRIAQTLAQLRSWSLPQTTQLCTQNTLDALPKLAKLLRSSNGYKS